MDKKMVVVFLAMVLVESNGLQPTNYDLSRNKVNTGAGYGHYPNYGQGQIGQYPHQNGPGLYPASNYPGGNYPGSNYPGGNYPGSNYPGGNYPGNHVVDQPGAHPGCPLCDSSVYGYCSHKQAHDSCCCENPAYLPYSCRKSDCKFLYANSCQEYQLISSCCCIDVQKSAVNSVEPVVGVLG